MILFTGPLFDTSGYATVSRGLVKTLGALTVGMRLRPNKEWSQVGVKLCPEEYSLIKRLIISDNEVVEAEHLVVYAMQKPVQGQVPVNFKRTTQIIHTMFETDRCPAEWVELYNIAAQHILVPSKWGVDVFKNSGVKNVEYMPFCIDTDLFSPKTVKTLSIPGFKFLFMGDHLPRKNIKGVLGAFFSKFRDNKDVVLILKVPAVHVGKMGQFPQEIKTVRTSMGIGQFPRVVWYGGVYPESSMPGFINSCDCLVAPSCGEGFGLPQLYAMACGKPVIGVNWSASTDYFTLENSLNVSYNIKPVPYEIVHQDRNFYGHQWAEPSQEHLMLLMDWAYRNQGELPAIGEKARRTVIEKYSQPVVLKLMENFLKERGLG